ncbi:MAG: tetratricopeptide repeat protein [Pirellulales bacterium]|nr:tetratricopeptide repeat protein [Pirellulales bacterium]
MKRLNLKLLTLLVITALVLVIGVSLLWNFQMRRNSRNHVIWADQAAKKGDLPEELKQLRRYLIYDEDDVKIQRRYALRLCDLAESPQSDKSVLMLALNQLQIARRNSPKDPEILDRLATFYQKLGRAVDGIPLFEQLLALQPKNADAKKKLAECHLFSREFDKSIELLRSAIEDKPQDITIYGRLSVVYENGKQQPEEAAKVIDEMVSANPESWEAYLARYQYRKSHNRGEEADADLNRALELQPTQLGVLLAAAERASTAREFDKARGFLDRAREAHPNARDVYMSLSTSARAQNDVAEAEKWIQEGLKEENAGEDRALLWMLADLKVVTRDLDGTLALIPRLEKAGTPKEQVEFLRALIFMQEKRYTESQAILDRIRPAVASSPVFEEQVDVYRAMCFRALGQPDREIEVYRHRLLVNPLAAGTRIDLARALLMNGQIDEAIQELQSVSADIRAQSLLYQALLVRNLRSPEAQRDWTKTDELVQQIRQQNPDNVNGLAIEVDYLIKKGQPDAALALLNSSSEKFGDNAIFWRAQAEVSSIKSGPAEGLKVLDAARQKLGDSNDLRLQQISYLSQIGDDAAKQKIVDIVAKVDELPEAERIPLLQSAAAAFNRLRDFSRSGQYYEEIAKRDPADLTALLMIFSVAREANDEAKMQDAIARIKEMVGEDNSYFLFCRASALVWEVVQGKAQPDALVQAGKLLDKAAQQRPNWGLLLSLRGEIDERDGNVDAAIASYKRAVSLGDTSPQLLRRLVVLLINRSRGPEAKALLANVPNPRESLGPRLSVVMKLLDGDVQDAMKLASEALAEDAENAQLQLWFAMIASNSGYYDEAEKAFRRATELGPESSDCWMGLFRFLVERQRTEEARTLLPNIEKHVAEKSRPLVMAQCLEMVGDAAEAEKHYQQAVAADPDNLLIKRELASFYARRKNTEALNKELTELSERGRRTKPSEISDDDRTHILWANRMLVSLAAQQGRTESLHEALALLDRNANADGKLGPDDVSIKIGLLARLGDPSSRQVAIDLARSLLLDDPARVADRLQLAKLLDRDNRWAECKDEMLTLISMQGDNAEVNLTYADMLLRHGESENAVSLINKLEETHPRDPLFLAIKARLLSKQDKAAEAIALLRGQIVRPLPPNQVPLLKTVAVQLIDLGRGSTEPDTYNVAAEELLREYVSEVPNDVLSLAEFLGRRGDLDGAFDVMRQAIERKLPIEPTTRLAMTLLNDYHAKATDAQFADAEKWLNQGLAADPNDIALQLQLAQYYDLRGNYDEAVKVYRELKDREELDKFARITVYNNLAFILAVKDKNAKEAEPLIDQAIEATGLPSPVSELLDTRGVVKLAKGDLAGALEDLKGACESAPSGIKLFHLAWAQHESRDDVSAAKTFEEAQKLGLNASTISALERPKFDELRKILPQTQAAAAP